MSILPMPGMGTIENSDIIQKMSAPMERNLFYNGSRMIYRGTIAVANRSREIHRKFFRKETPTEEEWMRYESDLNASISVPDVT